MFEMQNQYRGFFAPRGSVFATAANEKNVAAFLLQPQSKMFGIKSSRRRVRPDILCEDVNPSPSRLASEHARIRLTFTSRGRAKFTHLNVISLAVIAKIRL